jgi:hypothetical protein
VVGGMLFSTFLTLVLVPVVYTILGKYTKVTEREKVIHGGDAAGEAPVGDAAGTVGGEALTS